MLKNNRKGAEMAMNWVVVAALVLVILLLSGVFVNKFFVGSAKSVASCSAKGGTCAKICTIGKEIPWTSSSIGGCAKSEICCIPLGNDLEPSPQCEDKKLGDSCGTNSYCDKALQCVTKCEFCSTNAAVKDFRALCSVNSDKDVDAFIEGGMFTCGCTLEQCEEKEKDGNCIRNYCGSDNANYCCVR